MKKLTYLILACFFLSINSCAYESAYREYAVAQSNIAQAAGPIVSFHTNGQLASVGNPMIAMAMMNMKEPKDGWTQFFDWLKLATPFAAIYGIVGAMSNVSQGSTTNVQGNSNLVGNTAGPAGGASSWASPVTTTTITETTVTGVE